jgi:dTDP-4-dehydrorhamnose reductase
MIALVLGSNGQLGSALQATKPDDVKLIARDLPEFDLTDPDATAKLVEEASADVIINAAAYTAVDKAETEQAAAFQANVAGVGIVANAAERHGARFIHISTDYVFDGTKGYPYRPDDQTSPLGVYGRTKLDGEKKALAACGNCLIVRTAWLYGDQGANFVKTMLRLMASHPQVRVVSDQIGTPTYARSLAEALWMLARSDHRGVLHYTDSGVASWYDFACAIQEEALRLGLLNEAVPVLPISTAEFPTPARRPSFGILDKSETWALLGKPAAHWRTNLRAMLERMKNA